MSSLKNKKWIFRRGRRAPSRFSRGLFWGGFAVVLGGMLGLGLGFYEAIPKAKPFVVEVAPYKGVVVFTGGQGRVQTGFEVLEVFKNTAFMLISGVNPVNTRRDVLNISAWQAAVKQFAGRLDLDYQSQTTFGNIAQTKRWVQKNELKHIVLVTSDYHIPRVKLLFEAHLPDVEVFVYPVVSRRYGGALLVSEFVKYIAVRLDLAFGGQFLGADVREGY